MEGKKRVWIKKEEANDMSAAASVYLEDPSVISRSTESIKEDPSLNLEAEETDNSTDTHLKQFELDQLEGAMKLEEGVVVETPPPQQKHPLLSMLLLQPSPTRHQPTPLGEDAQLLHSPGQRQTSVLLEAVPQHDTEPGLVGLQHPGTPPNTQSVCMSPPHVSGAATVASATVLSDDVEWFPQSAMHCLVPEQLDLRPNCTADNMIEPQDVPVLASASGVLGATSASRGDCCGLPTEHAPHNQHRGEEKVPVRQMCDGSISPTVQQYHNQHHHELVSLLSRQNPASDSSSSSRDILNDEALMSLSALELNKKLHGYPREEVVRIKQKRRALKNRSYSQKCRSKWLQQRQELRGTNRALVAELRRLRGELLRITQQRDLYKQYLEQQMHDTVSAPPPCHDTASATSPTAANLDTCDVSMRCELPDPEVPPP
ncbi:transcription factor MafB-like isoform X2 [Schistocerca piceifrons]|uniref:transcription factor MafB-like isoform X2 n=1 Tax=Schistocerca piceifrons TaxID=274613 RepID=UPI001F5FD9F3|nr:transcription factor MafB-like isoform X2 [Schistocerca piceifrons]XP_047118810.1 transcription factor MafB-like isoform X2 [Schistocerca piceifrons]